MRGLALACALGALGAPGVAQPRHKQPSALAAKVGTHLPWESELENALAEAKRKKKLVFWYVPTIPGSPVDRKPVYDLYWRAGFFSDSRIEALLRRSYVLLRRVPSRAEAERHGLRPFRFYDPGFVLLDAEGKELDRGHGVTTFSAGWLASHLGRGVTQDGSRSPGPIPERSGPLGDARRELAVARPQKARALLAKTEDPEKRFYHAAATWLCGEQAEARELWRALARDHPRDPQGWRAAAEAEGFGPIARGFWIFRTLPEGGSPKGAVRVEETEGGRYEVAHETSRAARDVEDLPMLRRRSLAFLLSRQGEHGGWEDSNYDFGGQDSLPNVYVAVTALCCRAILRHRALDPVPAARALARGLAYVCDPKRTNEKDLDEWIWAKSYPMQLVAECLEAGVEFEGFEKKRLRAELARLVRESLVRQGPDGAIRHEYPNPFVTASLLHALAAAKAQGALPDETRVARALDALERCRTRLGAFTYGQVGPKRKARASLRGAAGRMPLAESALLAWGRGSRTRVLAALDAAFEHHDALLKSRKYDDHAGALAIGGFFFWYDLRGRELAFALVGSKAAAHRKRQVAQICAIAEIDGCFVDSPELGRSYGTAMALLCLPVK